MKDKFCVMSNSQFVVCRYFQFNSLPNDTFLDQIQKHFADDSSNVAEMVIFVFDRDENIVEKGENAGYQHFLLFPQSFQKASSPEKSGLCSKELNLQSVICPLQSVGYGRYNGYQFTITLSQTSRLVLTCPHYKAFGDTVGK